MYCKYRNLIFIITTFLFLSITKSYCAVKFSIKNNQKIGCPPFDVVFINKSDNISDLHFVWQMGIGGESTNSLQADALFDRVGVHTITLSAYDSNDILVGSFSDNIEVYEPSVEFSASPRDVCVEQNVNFQSQVGDLPSGVYITEYIWNFGDGSAVPNEKSPTHNYVFGDEFDVFLQVKDNNGCYSNVAQAKQYILVRDDVPKIDISYSPDEPIVCNNQLDVEIFNNTVSSENYSYNWNFGDGSTSTESNPQKHHYSNYGKYVLTGSVTNSIGCSTRIPDLQVLLLDFDSPDMQIRNSRGESVGNRVCAGEVITFWDNTEGAIYREWSIDDSLVSVDADFDYIFDSGVHNVKLITTNGYCEISETRIIEVETINNEVFIDNAYACSLPQTVVYTANDDIKNYNLDWYVNRSHYTASTFSIDFDDEIVLHDSLLVSTPTGCRFKIDLPTVELKTLQAAVAFDKEDGCVPLEVNFTDLTNYQVSEGQDSIVERRWRPMSGIEDVNNFSNYQYTYNIDGKFDAELEVVTAKGCRATAVAKIVAGTVPQVDFRIENPDVCAGEAVKFVDLSEPADKIDYRMLQFSSQHNHKGNGDAFGGLGMTELYPIMDNDTGWFNMVYQVKYNGCKSDPEVISLQNAVHVKGPVAFVHINTIDCSDVFSRTFVLDSIYAADNWSWNFDDENSINNITENIVTHKYSVRGDYTPMLSATNGDCFYQKPLSVKITLVESHFDTKSPVCMGDIANFDCNSSVDADKLWWISIAPNNKKSVNKISPIYSFEEKIPLIYDMRGDYSVGLIAEDVNGCRDTSWTTVRSSAPYAGFGVTKLETCVNSEVGYQNQSQIFDTRIKQLEWKSDSLTVVNTQNEFYTSFENVGKQPMMLKIWDENMCTDSVVGSIDVIASNADFEVVYPHVCTDNEAEFRVTKNTGTSLVWNFGDGTPEIVDMSSVVKHVYHSVADTVRLYSVIRTRHGDECRTPVWHKIRVSNQHAEIELDRDSLGCYKFDYIFTPRMKNFVPDFEWYSAPYGNFDNKNYPYAEPFIQFPEMAGWHKIMLVTHSDYRGCESDTAIADVYISGARANFEVSKDVICIGESVDFRLTADTMNIANSQFSWFFGDGNKLDQIIAPSHAYSFLPEAESFTVTFRVPTCIDVPQHNITIRKVMADFLIGANDDEIEGCLPHIVHLYNRSVGADNLLWTLPDGSQSTDENPTFILNKNFNPNEIRLSVSNNSIDCPNTKVREVEILPSPAIELSTKINICEGDSALLVASGDFTSFQWSPRQGLSNPDNLITNVVVDRSQYFYFEATNSEGCKSTDSVWVWYQPEPQYSGAPSNLLIYKDLYSGDLEIAQKGDYIELLADESYILNNEAVAGVFYDWQPSDGLSCDNCANPEVKMSQSGTYVLRMYDTVGCFDKQIELQFRVKHESKVDVPSAFSPNADGENDLFRIRGWGIDHLNYFRIYNRWGQLVFETNQFSDAWDGTFNGESQPVGTFVYIYECVDVNGETIFDKGYFDLLR